MYGEIVIRSVDGLPEVPFDVPTNPSMDLFGMDLERFVSEVREALEANAAAIACSVTYKSPCFVFARRLKANEKLCDLAAEDAAEHVELALGEIFEQDKEEFLWESVLGDADTAGEHIDPYTDFLYCWDNCHSPGEDRLTLAVVAALNNPPDKDHFGSRYVGLNHKGFREFLAVMEELQRLQGDQPIFIPRQAVSKALGVCKTQITRWCSMAEGKFLFKIRDGVRGRATEYWFGEDRR